MRTFLVCFIIQIIICSTGFGQEKIDVVYLKNGDVRKGTIIENVPNEYVKIETNDGSIFTIKYADIQKMTKEARSASVIQQSSTSQDTPKGLMLRSHDFGIVGGLWLGGEVSLGYWGRVDKSAGFLMRVFYDEFIMEKLSVGAYVNFSPTSSEASTMSATMFEIGASIKPRFPISDGAAVLKPGLNIGYRMYSSDSPSMDKIDAMGLNLSIEIQFNPKNKVVPFIECGFLAQPVGGNIYSDVTFAPIIYLGGGVAF